MSPCPAVARQIIYLVVGVVVASAAASLPVPSTGPRNRRRRGSSEGAPAAYDPQVRQSPVPETGMYVERGTGDIGTMTRRPQARADRLRRVRRGAGRGLSTCCGHLLRYHRSARHDRPGRRHLRHDPRRAGEPRSRPDSGPSPRSGCASGPWTRRSRCGPRRPGSSLDAEASVAPAFGRTWNPVDLVNRLLGSPSCRRWPSSTSRCCRLRWASWPTRWTSHPSSRPSSWRTASRPSPLGWRGARWTVKQRQRRWSDAFLQPRERRSRPTVVSVDPGSRAEAAAGGGRPCPEAAAASPSP